MKNYVIINGVSSQTITGLMINELPPITKPEMRTQREEIDGRDGDIITKLGYSAYDKTITIGLFGSGYDVNSIISFFNSEGTIVFSNEPDKYYNFTMLSEFDIERLQIFKTASITFHCQPFKYPLTETPMEIEPQMIELENVETPSISNTTIDTLKIDLKGNTSQASTPTPTSPIPVSVVSGDNTIEVVGKNLINVSNMTTEANRGITFTVKGTGINTKGTATTTYAQLTQYAPLNYNIPIGTYTLEYSTTSTKPIGVWLYDSNNNIVGTFKKGQTITTTGIGVKYRFFIEELVANTQYDIDFNDIMLVPSNASGGTYEPYQSQTYEVDLPVENILSLTDGTYTANGVTAVVSNGEITLNGTPNGSTSFILIPSNINTLNLSGESGDFTLSANNLSIVGNNGANFTDPYADIRIVNGSTIEIHTSFGVVNSYQSHSVTTINTTSFQVRTANGLSYNNFVIKPQLERGNKSNTYQPYGTTPIELCKIGNYQDKFIKGTGKNLFDGIYYKTYTSGSSPYPYAEDNNCRSGIIKVQPSTKYTISKGTSNRFRIGEYTQYPQLGEKAVNYISSDSSTVYTITTGNTTQYLMIQTTNEGQDNVQMQVELGSTRTYFEPYNSLDKWLVYKEVDKVVLNGTETSWNYNGDTTNYGQFVMQKADKKYGALNIICDRFQTELTANANAIAGRDANSNVYITIAKSIVTYDLNAFKTWLSSNNVTTYYVLANPYCISIPDTLQEQINTLGTATSYDGTTNVGQVNNDKAFLLDIKALEDGTNELVINNIGNIYAKPTIELEGNGNGGIYLNDNQIFSIDFTDKMTISTSMMEAYDPDTSALLNRQVIGNYNSMTLQPGNNTIKITGGIDKATITNYTRWL